MLCHQNALLDNRAVVTLSSAADRLMILPEDGSYSQETESRVLQNVLTWQYSQLQGSHQVSRRV